LKDLDYKISVSEKDYKILMELSKELQLQENDNQAFPYFWGAGSTKHGIGTEDDEAIVYDSNACETYTLEGYAIEMEEYFQEFLHREDLRIDTPYSDIEESSWQYWVDYHIDEATIVYQREEQVYDHNFSLFKSDVKRHIKGNSHHLGKDPHTYARTISRMPKMEELVKIIYRINKQSVDDVNDEAKRFIFGR